MDRYDDNNEPMLMDDLSTSSAISNSEGELNSQSQAINSLIAQSPVSPIATIPARIFSPSNLDGIVGVRGDLTSNETFGRLDSEMVLNSENTNQPASTLSEINTTISR